MGRVLFAGNNDSRVVRALYEWMVNLFMVCNKFSAISLFVVGGGLRVYLDKSRIYPQCRRQLSKELFHLDI